MIADVEQAVGAASASGTAAGFDAGMALAHLYTVYAQGVLRRHGVVVDLEDLCRLPWGTKQSPRR
ncbi:hypothetical protein [Azospirillum picis]|uniref:Uncharacterized protein n=1 Tax=Azospirillum picis TaxID=488438 RepID=A0ABU0MIG9_9PROT|nr:hypothetical protein [Azospirillum picis]MBP2299308.1 hypothetical protein [Azospirillum picis]MDQ0533054.1 hypothetical protein [Azospirillum picis]